MLPEFPLNKTEQARLRSLDPYHEDDSLHQAILELLIKQTATPNLYLRTCSRGRDERRRMKRWRPEYLRQRIYIREVDSPEESLAKIELCEVIQAEVLRLKGRDQQIIQLRFFDGCSSQEIARRMQLKPANVNTILHRIMERLKSNSRLRSCL